VADVHEARGLRGETDDETSLDCALEGRQPDPLLLRVRAFTDLTTPAEALATSLAIDLRAGESPRTLLTTAPTSAFPPCLDAFWRAYFSIDDLSCSLMLKALYQSRSTE
jgi:hypothetical protein